MLPPWRIGDPSLAQLNALISSSDTPGFVEDELLNIISHTNEYILNLFNKNVVVPNNFVI